MKLKIILIVAFIAIATVTITKFSSIGKASTSKNSFNALPDPDIIGWSKASMMAVQMMKKQYGEPNEKTATMMMWHNTGQWSHTVVYAKEFKHDFPMPHTDVMEQWINYNVPTEKFTELAMYDGSITCNRTNGTISARCDKEGANFLAINLANDIIKGKKDVKTARDFYATTVKEFINGGKPAYMQKLQFDVAQTNTTDSDKPSSIITQDDMMKMKKMMEIMEKEMMGMKDDKMGNDGNLNK